MDSRSIQIDKEDAVPIVDQIVNSITRLILHGQLQAGEKLPTERSLAADLGIARGTVQRAYLKLAQSGVVESRKGSGSYVLTDERLLESSKKQEAADILAATLSRLRAMGLSEKEIQNLINLHRVSHDTLRKVNLMVVSNNYEILAELEKQLSYLSGTSLFSFTLSFFTLDHVLGNPDPVQMLYGYDLIIATSIDYPDICAPVPMFQSKIVEATISPSTETLIGLSDIPKDAKVSVVYRTEPFRKMVTDALLSLGFARKYIHAYQEYSYNPVSHAENGVSLVISFNESLVNLNPAFQQRNEQFVLDGGILFNFKYRIDRASLIAIEDRIQALLAQVE